MNPALGRSVAPLFWGTGHESTRFVGRDDDNHDATGHSEHFVADHARLRKLGIRHVREAVLWHKVEKVRGKYDWSDTWRRFEALKAAGFDEITWDLQHHINYPRRLDSPLYGLKKGAPDRWSFGLGHPLYQVEFSEFVLAWANEFGPYVNEYMVQNEAHPTHTFAARLGIWPPFGKRARGAAPWPPSGSNMRADIVVMLNWIPAVINTARMLKKLMPHAKHVWNESLETHLGVGPVGSAYARFATDRSYFISDLAWGRPFIAANFDVDSPSYRPYADAVSRFGGDALFELSPARFDVFGGDYYAQHEWLWRDDRGESSHPNPGGIAAAIKRYHQRYPTSEARILEVNCSGTPEDRQFWAIYTWRQCQEARKAGVPLTQVHWFGATDSRGWNNSLRNHAERAMDPVGLYGLDDKLRRQDSVLTRTVAQLQAGIPVEEIPAHTPGPAVKAMLQGQLDWLQTTGQPMVATPIGYPSTPFEILLDEALAPLDADVPGWSLGDV